MNSNGLSTYLLGFRNDVFKLLPMKETADAGTDNHLADYLDMLISNVKGAMKTFPELEKQRRFINVVNNLSYLAENEVPFAKWRKIILNSTRSIEDLKFSYNGGSDK